MFIEFNYFILAEEENNCIEAILTFTKMTN